MADPFAGGQITHLLSLRGSGRKRPFGEEMLAGIQSGHPHLMVKRYADADRDEVHVGMLDHFIRVGKSVGDAEMLGRFVGSFLPARADRVISNSGTAPKAGLSAPLPQPYRTFAPIMPTP